MWVQKQVLVASDGAQDNSFSWDIAFDGNTLFIYSYGAGRYTDMGAAYVFTLQAGQWREKQKLTAAKGEKSDYFGYNVAVCSNTLVVGAIGNDDGGYSYIRVV